MSMDVDQNHESGVEQFGDMIRFLGPLRCTSCQQTDGRCVIGRDEMRCLLCAGASKDCQFKRTITRTLPIRDLTWEEMTNPSSCYEVHVQQTSPDARQRFESHENRSPPPPPPQPRDPYQIRPLLSSRTSHADGSGLNSSNLESPTQSTAVPSRKKIASQPATSSAIASAEDLNSIQASLLKDFDGFFDDFFDGFVAGPRTSESDRYSEVSYVGVCSRCHVTNKKIFRVPHERQTTSLNDCHSCGHTVVLYQTNDGQDRLTLADTGSAKSLRGKNNKRRAFGSVTSPPSSISSIQTLASGSSTLGPTLHPTPIDLTSPLSTPPRQSPIPIGSNQRDQQPMNLDQRLEDASQAKAIYKHSATSGYGDVKKAVRRGPLQKDSRVKARTVRAIGACWPCKLQKHSCDADTTCASCRNAKPSLQYPYRDALCHRGPLTAMLEWIFPSEFHERINSKDYRDISERTADDLLLMTIHSEIRSLNEIKHIELADHHPVRKFIDNAVHVENAGRQAVFCALSTLAVCLRTLSRATSSQLSPEDDGISEPGFEVVVSNLAALFENMDSYLLKPEDGAGSAVCVAIGVLFIIFSILQRLDNSLHLSIAPSAGVVKVLETLFGLLSIAYRSTGILDVLQAFSGRELDPHAGEPAPDIIEALQELLSLPGYPSSQKRSQPLGDSSTENQHTPYPETNSRTSPQRFQRLDPNVFYTRSRPRDFFIEGRVFCHLVTEALGGPTSNTRSANSSSVSSNSWGELAYSQIRRFIVVKVRPTENYSLCVAISTYGGRGVTKRGVDPQTHAIVYTSAHPPAQLENEPPLDKEPIKVVASSPEDKLAPASRVNLGKTYSVEMNVKVKEVGMVDRSCLPLLLSYWKVIMTC